MRIPFQDLNSSERRRLLEVGLVFALILWLAVIISTAYRYNWGNDFRFYWSGARTLLEGGNPHEGLNKYPGIDLLENEQFHNLPWVAAFFMPLSLVSFEAASKIWIGFNILMLLIDLKVVYDLGHNKLPLWKITLIEFAVVWLSIRCLQAGQLGITVTTFSLLGLHSFQRAEFMKSGLLYSMILLKPWILVSTLFFVLVASGVRRSYRFMAGMAIGGIGMISITTVIWPTWMKTFSQVDYSQILGKSIQGVYVEYWPLANSADFLHFILGYPADSNIRYWVWFVLTLAVVSLGFAAIKYWYIGKLDDLTLFGIGTLLGLMVLPYVRFYDYVILTIWFVGVYIGTSKTSVNRYVMRIITICVILAFICNLGNHLEPWVYQILIWLYAASWLFVLEKWFIEKLRPSF